MMFIRMTAYVIPILFFCAVACAQNNGRDLSNKIHAVIDTVHSNVGSDFVVERTEGVDPRFETIVDRLVKEDGWDEAFVRQLFEDSGTVFIPKLIVVKPRRKVNTGESSKACVDFIGLYDSILTVVEKQYGVDKETIAALLRCETRHGTVTGNYHVLSVYASMTLMGEPWAIADNVEKATIQMKDEGKSDKEIATEISWIKSRSKKRSAWAYKELSNLLKIQKSGKWDVRNLYGSWAGAFGWTQFLPSSYLRLAVDGDGDGKIDLYNARTAIAPVIRQKSRRLCGATMRHPITLIPSTGWRNASKMT